MPTGYSIQDVINAIARLKRSRISWTESHCVSMYTSAHLLGTTHDGFRIEVQVDPPHVKFVVSESQSGASVVFFTVRKDDQRYASAEKLIMDFCQEVHEQEEAAKRSREDDAYKRFFD